MKNSKKYLICLPAFYLIMFLMKSLKNSKKIAIFEICRLVSFLGVKIHFGEKYAWSAIEILFMEANLSFGYVMVPKINQKIISIQYRIDLVRKITIRGSVLVKIKKETFRGISPKWVLTPQKETSCHISKMAIFPKIFGDFMRHIIR